MRRLAIAGRIVGTKGMDHSKPYSTAMRHASLALALARPCWRRPCGEAKLASEAGHECAPTERAEGDREGERASFRGMGAWIGKL